MPGGARANSGPPPDPNAIRRDRPSDRAGWTTLPERREGEAPAWPLTRPKARELVLWTAEWVRPQAVMWEANGQVVEVAIYVRTLVAAEQPKAPVAVRTLLKQQQEALGLSLPGLNRLRWRIGPAPEPARKEAGTTDDRSRTTAKSRFKVLEGGETAAG